MNSDERNFLIGVAMGSIITAGLVYVGMKFHLSRTTYLMLSNSQQRDLFEKGMGLAYTIKPHGDLILSAAKGLELFKESLKRGCE